MCKLRSQELTLKKSNKVETAGHYQGSYVDEVESI